MSGEWKEFFLVYASSLHDGGLVLSFIKNKYLCETLVALGPKRSFITAAEIDDLCSIV